MMYIEVSNQLDESWEATKQSWKDIQAQEYEDKCIEPVRNALSAMNFAQQSIIQTIEDFDQKIKKYE